MQPYCHDGQGKDISFEVKEPFHGDAFSVVTRRSERPTSGVVEVETVNAMNDDGVEMANSCAASLIIAVT
jgi:hypothetical protein